MNLKIMRNCIKCLFVGSSFRLSSCNTDLDHDKNLHIFIYSLHPKFIVIKKLSRKLLRLAYCKLVMKMDYMAHFLHSSHIPKQAPFPFVKSKVS